MNISLSLILLGLAVISATTIHVDNNLPTDQYSPSAALDYLLLSELFPHVTVNSVVYANSTDTQGYIGTFEETVFVAFRGSMDISSWLTNLKFAQVAYPGVPGALVHSGFYEAWTSVQIQVEAGLADALIKCPQCKSMVVTGHSLGASIATFAMASLSQSFQHISKVSYTFGSPRLGNQAWVSHFNSLQPNNFRVVNHDDIVPHVPSEDIMFLYSYRHVPTEFWYPVNTTTYVECNSSGEDPECSDSVDPLRYKQEPYFNHWAYHVFCRKELFILRINYK
eukprot:gene15061-17826_t